MNKGYRITDSGTKIEIAGKVTPLSEMPEPLFCSGQRAINPDRMDELAEREPPKKVTVSVRNHEGKKIIIITKK